MTGGGIERALRSASAALTGHPSRGSAIPGATGCPWGGHRLSHEPGRTRCLATLSPPERCKGRHSPSIDRLRWAENRSLRSVFTLLRIEGRPVSAAAKNSAGPLPLELFAGCEVSPLSGPCACLHHWSAETRRETNRQTHRSSEQAGAIGAVVRHRRGYGRRLMAPYGHPTYH